MDSVEDYARQWTKREKEDLDTLSEWAKSVKLLGYVMLKITILRQKKSYFFQF